MGIDFLRRSAPSFHRALDRQAVALRTPTLFTSDVASVARTASAEVCAGERIQAGEHLLLRIMNEKLIAQRDNLVVAEFTNPPREFVSRIQNGAGVELGEVKAVRVLSGEVEVAFCE
jgi:hypothetical protein